MKDRSLLFLLAICAGAVFLVWTTRAQDEPGFTVIVNASNPIETVDKSRLSSMFLKKVKRWPEQNVEVLPFDLKAESVTRASFSEAVHGRSVSSIKNFWQRQIFSGRDVPPPELGSDEEMIKQVGANRGGIGYVSSKTRLPETVKALRIGD